MDGSEGLVSLECLVLDEDKVRVAFSLPSNAGSNVVFVNVLHHMSSRETEISKKVHTEVA